MIREPRNPIVAFTLSLLVVLVGTHRMEAADQKLLLAGSVGETFTVQGSNDLEAWQNIVAVVNATGSVEVPHSQLDDYDYYRVLADGGSPSNPLAVG
ncbi:MAG: hypothetical protein ACPGVU_05350 [Limisphaerales bacterium]